MHALHFEPSPHSFPLRTAASVRVQPASQLVCFADLRLYSTDLRLGLLISDRADLRLALLISDSTLLISDLAC